VIFAALKVLQIATICCASDSVHSMMQLPEIYQFHAQLRGISPPIWRGFLVRSDQTIGDLHYALQIALGWSDPHLNNFRIHGKDFGVYHIETPPAIAHRIRRRRESDNSNGKPPSWDFTLLKLQSKTPDFLRIGVSGETYRTPFPLSSTSPRLARRPYRSQPDNC
jgi:hypothetical protein